MDAPSSLLGWLMEKQIVEHLFQHQRPVSRKKLVGSNELTAPPVIKPKDPAELNQSIALQLLDAMGTPPANLITETMKNTSIDTFKAGIIESCAKIIETSGPNKEIYSSIHKMLQAVATSSNSTLPIKECPEKKIKMRFSKNLSSLPCSTPLIYVVSVSNLSQTGPYFSSFIELVNSNTHVLDKLILIDSSYLNRHYANRYSDKTKKTDWLIAHEKYFKNIEINYQFFTWDYIINPARENDIFFSYSDMKKLVLMDFDGFEDKQPDPIFTQIVNELANAAYHENIAPTLESARKYIIEECAAALTFNGVVTYPRSFNPAITYVVEKHNKNLILLTHKIKN